MTEALRKRLERSTAREGQAREAWHEWKQTARSQATQIRKLERENELWRKRHEELNVKIRLLLMDLVHERKKNRR